MHCLLCHRKPLDASNVFLIFEAFGFFVQTHAHIQRTIQTRNRCFLDLLLLLFFFELYLCALLFVFKFVPTTSFSVTVRRFDCSYCESMIFFFSCGLYAMLHVAFQTTWHHLMNAFNIQLVMKTKGAHKRALQTSTLNRTRILCEFFLCLLAWIFFRYSISVS